MSPDLLLPTTLLSYAKRYDACLYMYSSIDNLGTIIISLVCAFAARYTGIQ